MMARYNIPSSPRVYTSRYQGFVGCDFNTDPMCVDDRRFPYAQNLTLDVNGYPEKRPGYKEILSLPGDSHKIFRAVISGDEILLIHVGDTISVYKTLGKEVSPDSLCSLSTVKSCYFVAWENKVYVYGLYADKNGTGFVQKLEKSEDRFIFSDAIPDAYVPVTSIAGNVLTEEEYLKQYELGVISAGGQSYESVNLVGKKRINTFKLNTLNIWNPDSSVENFSLAYTVPHSLITDCNHSSDKFYNAILGLYLRLFCFEKGDWHRFHSTTYHSKWRKLYPENYEYTYNNYIDRCCNCDDCKGNGLPSLYPTWYTKLGSAALKEYADENFRVFTNGLYSLYYPKEDHGFKIEVLDNSSGWIELPIFAYSENTHHLGDAHNLCNYFFMLCDFGTLDEFLSSQSIPRIRMLRGGIFYHKKNAPSSLSFFPDITADVNIRITYSVSETDVQENIKKVTASDSCHMYGISGSADRVFVKGTGDEQHYVRFSDMDNPLYFPDLNYVVCGTPSTKTVAMFPFSSYLCVAKEQNFQDVSFFLVHGTMMEGEAAFVVKEGVPGVGLKTSGAYALSDDIPHFLSDNGVYYLTSVDITAKASVKNCSYFADSMIRNEPHDGATLFCYKNNILLSYPESGHVYVFNTNNKTYTSAAGADHFVYEVWLWTDVYASQFLDIAGVLYFITPDGKLMQFKPHGSIDCYSDEYDGEAHAIDAYFKTKAFDDGSFMTLKNMKKRGCGAALKPFTRSSATVYVITDRDEKHIKDLSADMFDWTYIDFVRFEFTSNPAIRIMPFNTKVKKYATIQFFVRNNEVGESFGVIGLEKAYTFGNYKKN